MDIGAGLVLYGIIWFMVLYVVLPLRLTTQGDADDVTPGTPAGAPHKLNMRRKLLITTLAAGVVWAIAASIIISGIIPVSTFDVMNLGSDG